MRSQYRQFEESPWSVTTWPFIVLDGSEIRVTKDMKSSTQRYADRKHLAANRCRNRDGPLIFHKRDGPPRMTGPPGGTGPPVDTSGNGPPKKTGPPMEWLVRKKYLEKLYQNTS